MNLLHVRPNHITDCFLDLIELLKHALTDCGVTVTTTRNTRLPGVNVVFGAHCMTPEQAAELEENDIIFQSEQLPMFWTPQYSELVRRCKVWDYSERNCDFLAMRGIKRVEYVPFGYHPAMDRVQQIPRDERQFDFTFYGSQHQRRRHLMASWWAEGSRVKFADNGVLNEERDELIAQSRILPTIHQFNDKVAPIHEMARVYYLMSNRACVLSEVNEDTHIYPWVRDAILTAPYDDMIDLGKRLSADRVWQEEIALRSHEAIRAHPMTEIIGRVL